MRSMVARCSLDRRRRASTHRASGPTMLPYSVCGSARRMYALYPDGLRIRDSLASGRGGGPPRRHLTLVAGNIFDALRRFAPTKS